MKYPEIPPISQDASAEERRAAFEKYKRRISPEPAESVAGLDEGTVDRLNEAYVCEKCSGVFIGAPYQIFSWSSVCLNCMLDIVRSVERHSVSK